jgi:aspartyl protease family protein
MHDRIFFDNSVLALATMPSFSKRDSLRTAAVAFLLAWAGLASAQTVMLNGLIGSRQALLVINGQAHTVAIGQTVKGVQLLSLAGQQAQVSIGGARHTLLLGAAQVRLAGNEPAHAQGHEIVLMAAHGGHFLATGQINGKSAAFMVDTGATKVSMSEAEAMRLGIDYKSGTRGLADTANGRVPVYGVTLSAVRVGDVEIANVEALVLPATMPHILLGNSFLSRFSMRRENEVMRLEKR